MGTLLHISNLAKTYPDFALQNVSLTVEEGSIVGLVGANGAGKTTTLKCLLGVAFPQEGSIKLMGEEVSRAANGYVGDKRFAQLRQNVGFVPDTCAFPLELTVKEVGGLCQKAFAQWDDALFTQLCRQFELGENKLVQELSRGMGMKLSLATALAHKPRLLVLDEATAGLDPLAREDVVNFLREYVAAENCGVLLSSHITSDLEKAADKVVCLNSGSVAFDLALDDICDTAGVARCTAAQLETLLNSQAYEPGQLRLRRGTYSTEVLVPDRFQCAEAFPEIAVERVSLDDYLSFMLKGEQA